MYAHRRSLNGPHNVSVHNSERIGSATGAPFAIFMWRLLFIPADLGFVLLFA